MIDIENIVEQLYQASLDSEDVAKKKMEIILSLALKSQISEVSEIIYKYQNQWERTQPSHPYTEAGDPISRLIRLLYSLINDDVSSLEKEISKRIES